jgi:glucosyl-dolichyl phosphate glucuronosyltransferase
MSMPSVSVVICAHTERRWDDTLAAVASVRRQSHPAEEVIVVVDHNRSLYERLKSVLADVLVVENREQQGLSGGKNTGIAMASGQVVAFLDDDAIADANWLKFLVDSYEQPGVVGVGGRTLPKWDTQRPSWFPAEFDWVVGCTYVGMPANGGPVRNLMGGNASFKREIFKEVGGFSSAIGRGQGKLPLGCEETEFCIRLTQQLPGTILLFDNRATIWHRVTAERCRFAYYWARCYAEGLSKAMVTRSVGANDGLSSERRYTTRTLPQGVVGGLAETVHGDGTGLYRAGAIVAGLASTSAGYAVGKLSGSQSVADITVRIRRLGSGGEQRGSDRSGPA